MTTTVDPRGTAAEPVKTLELEHVDIHEALQIPPVAPPAEVPTAARPWRRLVAVGILAGLAGVGVGYGTATWVANDQITGLERQASMVTTVPFGGFQSGYGAAQDHQALADSLAAGGSQGSWATAPDGARTFLPYPGAQLEVVYGPSSSG